MLGPAMCGGRGVPGVAVGRVGREGYYPGTLPSTLPVPIFNHILRLKPYLGPNEGNSMRFPEMGLE